MENITEKKKKKLWERDQLIFVFGKENTRECCQLKYKVFLPQETIIVAECQPVEIFIPFCSWSFPGIQKQQHHPVSLGFLRKYPANLLSTFGNKVICSLEAAELNVFDLNHMSYNAKAGVCM